MTTTFSVLDHERLDLYGVAVALDGSIVNASRKGPRGNAWLWDQAQRASASVVLNIAEACGREGADRARCLRISRGSALEVDAALNPALGWVEPAKGRPAREARRCRGGDPVGFTPTGRGGTPLWESLIPGSTQLSRRLSLLAHRGACAEDLRRETRELTVRVVAMLNRLITASTR